MKLSSEYQQCSDLFRNTQSHMQLTWNAFPGRVLGSSRAPCYINLELITAEQNLELIIAEQKHTEL